MFHVLSDGTHGAAGRYKFAALIQVNSLEEGGQAYEDMEQKLAHDPEYQLPDPQALMTAKSYKAKVAEPLVKRLKKLIKGLLVRYFKAVDHNHRLNLQNGKLYQENEKLIASNDRLREENTALWEQNRDYSLLRKVFGRSQIDDLVRQAREAQQAQRKRTRDRGWER